MTRDLHETSICSSRYGIPPVPKRNTNAHVIQCRYLASGSGRAIILVFEPKRRCLKPTVRPSTGALNTGE